MVDNLNTHWRLDLCEFVTEWCGLKFDAKPLRNGKQPRAFLTDATHAPRFHYVPKHGSWLNQIELRASLADLAGPAVSGLTAEQTG